MVRINWTHEAKYWLKYIHDYIAEYDPIAAQNVIKGIYAKVGLLGSFPEFGYTYAKVSNQNIRIILYGHYKIAYLIKDQYSIDILAVIHDKMDINKFMGKLSN
jgi:plasmid stabilization system protein ParE